MEGGHCGPWLPRQEGETEPACRRQGWLKEGLRPACLPCLAHTWSPWESGKTCVRKRALQTGKPRSGQTRGPGPTGRSQERLTEVISGSKDREGESQTAPSVVREDDSLSSSLWGFPQSSPPPIARGPGDVSRSQWGSCRARGGSDAHQIEGQETSCHFLTIDLRLQGPPWSHAHAQNGESRQTDAEAPTHTHTHTHTHMHTHTHEAPYPNIRLWNLTCLLHGAAWHPLLAWQIRGSQP